MLILAIDLRKLAVTNCIYFGGSCGVEDEILGVSISLRSISFNWKFFKDIDEDLEPFLNGLSSCSEKILFGLDD